jgi:hypothetical protein
MTVSQVEALPEKLYALLYNAAVIMYQSFLQAKRDRFLTLHPVSRLRLNF